jgi:hypothetical protein
MGLRIRIPQGTWKSVSCEYCVLSGRGLCVGLITRPEESYRRCCVVMCDLETSRMRRLWPALGSSATGGKMILKAPPKKKNHVDDILDTFLAVVYNQNTSANGQANLNFLRPLRSIPR